MTWMSTLLLLLLSPNPISSTSLKGQTSELALSQMPTDFFTQQRQIKGSLFFVTAFTIRETYLISPARFHSKVYILFSRKTA